MHISLVCALDPVSCAWIDSEQNFAVGETVHEPEAVAVMPAPAGMSIGVLHAMTAAAGVCVMPGS